MNGTNSAQYSAACQNTAATQPNQSVNGGTAATQYNICPAGWRLPTPTSATTGDFYDLVTNLGWTSGGPAPLFTNGNFMYSGNWTNGAFNLVGSLGYYWSSTASTATTSRSLGFSGTGVTPFTNYDKRAGFAVRCVAP